MAFYIFSRSQNIYLSLEEEEGKKNRLPELLVQKGLPHVKRRIRVEGGYR